MKGTQFDELSIFTAVADNLSFARAARQLGVSATVASRKMAALEERLGVRLLNRTTRSVALTQAGAELLADLVLAMAGLDMACKRIAARDCVPRGRLRINLPRIAAQCVVMPSLPTFSVLYPHVEVDLVIDDHMRDIVADGFDAGIRLGDMIQKDMTAVRLTPDVRMTVVGSPTYLRDRSRPTVPADLLEHRCLTYRYAESRVLQPWTFEKGSGPVIVNPVSVLTANDTDTLLAAALSGLGLAYLGDLLVRQHAAAGRLMPLLDDWSPPLAGFFLYHPGRTLMPAPSITGRGS